MRMISALDSTMGDKSYITIGQDNSVSNQAEIAYYHVGAAWTNSRLDFGRSGAALAYLRWDGRFGISTTAPRAQFEVVGSNNFKFGIEGSTTVYSYSMTSGQWANNRLGPVTATRVSVYFGGTTYAQGMYYASDRRLMSDITPLRVSYEQFNKLNPSIYRFKDETKMRMGLIAQEASQVFSKLISYSANDQLKKGPLDLDGVQLSVDYGQLASINSSVIKELIAQAVALQSKINAFSRAFSLVK